MTTTTVTRFWSASLPTVRVKTHVGFRGRSLVVECLAPSLDPHCPADERPTAWAMALRKVSSVPVAFSVRSDEASFSAVVGGAGAAVRGGGAGVPAVSAKAAVRGSLAPPFWSPELPEVLVAYDVPEGGSPHQRPIRAIVTALLLLLCLALPAGAQTLTGVVSRVSDGDTLVVGKVKVRLFGIDAPEGRQECVAPGGRSYRCGDTAKGFLARLAPPKASISCAVRAVDRYGRLVGRCVVNGKDLSQWMVRAGWAVAYREYSVAYVPEEGAARVARRGLWAGTFVSPEEWRHAH